MPQYSRSFFTLGDLLLQWLVIIYSRLLIIDLVIELFWCVPLWDTLRYGGMTMTILFQRLNLIWIQGFLIRHLVTVEVVDIERNIVELATAWGWTCRFLILANEWGWTLLLLIIRARSIIILILNNKLVTWCVPTTIRNFIVKLWIFLISIIVLYLRVESCIFL